MTGFYIGIDGKARKVKGGYIGVDGKARKIKKGYIGDENGVARLCWTAFEADPVFENNTWENIALACQLNAVPDTWAVGDQKTMTINGVDYTIDIIGKNHDDYADGSGKAPLTFQLHDCYKTTHPMHYSVSNYGSWSNCDMRNKHLPSILTVMPTSIQNSIREVRKTTSAGNTDSTVVVTNDKLFLLSELEVFNTTNYSYGGEGLMYSYYESNSAIKIRSGNTVNWWLRSPYKNDTEKYCSVTVNGTIGLSNCNNSMCVSFAFCF